jgi:hypothetical protein
LELLLALLLAGMAGLAPFSRFAPLAAALL